MILVAAAANDSSQPTPNQYQYTVLNLPQTSISIPFTTNPKSVSVYRSQLTPNQYQCTVHN